MASITVHPLNCPDCHDELVGLSYDKVFYCRRCRSGVHYQDGVTTFMPVHFAQPSAAVDIPDFYLPFWRIQGTVRVDNMDPKHHVIAETINQFPAIWVSGFLTLRRDTFGDLGERYTTGKINPKEDISISQETQLIGTTRNMSEAIGYAHLHLTDMLDKRADVTGVSLSIDDAKLSLWGIPFIDNNDRLIDLILREQILSLSIIDLQEIKNARP